ncbi:allantoicase [Arenimonas sp.]|uniref:allantoicase n=1 Tax=Arenimonas sp. TaxID=1872635 RepID=UPI0039E4DB10
MRPQDEAPDFTRECVNLANARLGALALATSDDFFAPMERMLDAREPVFIPDKYDDNGKWMDGWESRRKRVPGHDWCIVRLARPGRLHGVDFDTRHFTGNYPPGASLEGCYLRDGDPGAATEWFELLPRVPLQGNSHHYHALDGARPVSHVRLNIYPDGGVARLRLYGRPEFDPARRDDDGLVDLASALNGAVALIANDEHFGRVGNLLLPGRGVDMGDGWETRRRREPGHDWCLLALAGPGVIEAIEVDTAHFKGNYPARCSLQAAHSPSGDLQALVAQAENWPLLLPEQTLQMDLQHYFREQIRAHGPVTHVRLNIFPDGGVSRLRLRGRPA